jgi:hypothetical protein
MIGLAEKTLFNGKVIDNEDVFLLNRIRVKPEYEKIQEILDSLDPKLLNAGRDDIKEEYWYEKDDPFVFYPLFPSMSAVPLENEMVWVMYSNASLNKSRKEQFYLPSSKTNPFNVAEESFEQTLANTSQGFNTILGKQFKSKLKNIFGKREYQDPGLFKGIFAEPGDNSFYGRGTSDIILKKDEVLIRAGKTTTMIGNSMSNTINEKRGFLQMSYYRTEYLPEESEKQQTSIIDESPLRKLIEYVLFNPENTMDKFTGEIFIYDTQSAAVKNNDFTSDTEISKSQIWSYKFDSLPMSSVTELINSVITGLNRGEIEIKEPFVPKRLEKFDESTRFPYYYRPSSILQNRLSSSPRLTSNPADNLQEYNSIMNISKLVSAVRFPNAILDVNGSGLVSKRDKFGISRIKKTIEVKKQEQINSSTSVSILGATEICLLSNELASEYLTKENIYGIGQEEFYKNIIPKTEPLVRGEKLKQLLNLIVNFLTTHVHAYHGLPPNPTSYSSVTVGQLEQNFQTYDSEVLNQNIRIN